MRACLQTLTLCATALLGVEAEARATPPLPVAVQYKQNLDETPERAVVRAARFLVERQGMWPGSAPGRVVLDGWEWLVGSGKGAPNIAGLVALGLLDAHEATGREEFLAAARARAELSAAQLRRGEEVFAPDVELVARVGRADDDAELVKLARGGLRQRIKRVGGAEQEVRRIVTLREAAPGLAGYDIAMLADAALTVGEDELARALLETAHQVEREWLRQEGSTFAIISEGALLASATRAGADELARGFAVSLLARQQPDGSWRARETQATAYATRGLALFARRYSDRTAAAAAARGRDWLRLTQLKNGSWADYSDYLPEPFVGEVFSPATAEALRAVVAAQE